MSYDAALPLKSVPSQPLFTVHPTTLSTVARYLILIAFGVVGCFVVLSVGLAASGNGHQVQETVIKHANQVQEKVISGAKALLQKPTESVVYQDEIIYPPIPEQPLIVVVTATHRRPERLADMTRLANTLANVPDVFWIVVEDDNYPIDQVQRLLQRSGIPHVYMQTTTMIGFPYYGTVQKNLALEYIRQQFANTTRHTLVYIADDDNSYDLRVFDYIRQVNRVGVWAVGLPGMAIVEAPRVENGTVVGFDVVFDPTRPFAVDMAGFAVDAKLLIETNATFHRWCNYDAPESCLLEQLNINVTDLEPFGYDVWPKDVVVWHTKTKSNKYYGSFLNYTSEY